MCDSGSDDKVDEEKKRWEHIPDEIGGKRECAIDVGSVRWYVRYSGYRGF